MPRRPEGGGPRRAYDVYAKDVWPTQIVTPGSVLGVNTCLQPAPTAFHGPVAIRETYGATEGTFGQQRNERRA